MRTGILTALLFGLALAGCASHSAYDTAQFRSREYAVNRITLNEGGLDSSQIQWTKIYATEYKITSAIDFIVVDAQTTAILSSDRLLSTITYAENLFKAGEREKAQDEIFSEQGAVLGRKITELFQQQ